VLARRLAISRTTATAAYDLLRQRGELHSVRGSGTTVTGNRTK
jgi:DNA-binding GntR family transcriptional regulator